MALNVVCPKGHPYVQADIYTDLPAGAPACPVCFEEWLKEQGAKLQGEIATGNAHAVVLSLKSGDVLVITYEHAIPREEHQRIKEYLEDVFPNNKVLILSRGPWLTVIHPEA